EPTTKPSEQTGDILWGDADVNGEVDILDVITLNKAIMGKETLKPQGEINADVDQSGKPDAVDSMNILKLIVNMLTQADFPIK
ncbi:MAG: dockerin type I repeat-containing protein, partial [Oscillospiraceae bacterium]|nr:dockerin type I repeat-containing protein [Oscillospiraceae bacterium]